MKKKLTLTSIIGLSILVCIFGIGLIYFFAPMILTKIWGIDESYPGGFPDYYGHDYGYYRINPETILADITAGKENVFMPDERDIENDVWGGPVLYNLPVLWHSPDYFMIAKELNQFAFADTLKGWKLYSMYFGANCSDIPAGGFRYGGFSYFKTGFGIDGPHYVMRSFIIDPEYLNVTWGGGASYLRSYPGWKNIDLDKVKISPEDAVKIAEEHGGREAHLKEGNQCELSISLAPRYWDGWWVRFGYRFDLNVDPYTGEILK